MIIKSFTAESTAAALKLIRQEMGGEAIVLKTRPASNSSTGPLIEVTACLEKPSVSQSSVLLATKNEGLPSAVDGTPGKAMADEHANVPVKTDSVNRLTEQLQQAEESNGSDAMESNGLVSDSEPSARINAIDEKLDKLIALGALERYTNYLSPELDAIANRLFAADFSRDFIYSFIRSLEKNFPNDGELRTAAHCQLVTTLSELMTPTMKFEAGDSLLFMGPAGSGKTSLMGKVALRLTAQDGLKIRLASLDDYKLAAQEELQSFADFLGVETADLDRSKPLNRNDKGMITLIDSPALPTDPAQFEKLRVDIDNLKPSHRFAVFSALTRSTDTTDIAQRMTALSPTDLIVTMLDQTERYGSIIAAAEASKKKIAFVTDAPGGIGEAKAPDPDRIARTIFDNEAAIESTETK